MEGCLTTTTVCSAIVPGINQQKNWVRWGPKIAYPTGIPTFDARENPPSPEPDSILA